MHFKTSFRQEKTNFGHLKQRQNCSSFVLLFSCVTHLKIQIKSLFKNLAGSKNRIKRNWNIWNFCLQYFFGFFTKKGPARDFSRLLLTSFLTFLTSFPAQLWNFKPTSFQNNLPKKTLCPKIITKKGTSKTHQKILYTPHLHVFV